MPIVPDDEMEAAVAQAEREAAGVPGDDYPEPQPPETKDDLASLLAMSDKELRISIAGILQACIQSMPLYSANQILDRDTWRASVKEEASYWIKYALNLARKDQ